MTRYQLKDILRHTLVQHGFKAAVLTDEAGLPVVALPDGPLAEAPAAMVALIRRVFDQVHESVGLGTMDEMTLRDRGGQLLVCRRIVIEPHDLVLAILVPPDTAWQPGVDQAVKRVIQAWPS